MSVGASAASRTSNLSMMRLCIFLSIFAVFPASNSSFSPLWRKEAIIIDSPHQVEHPIPRLSEWHTCLGIVTLQVTIAPIEDTVKSELGTSQSHRGQAAPTNSAGSEANRQSSRIAGFATRRTGAS